MPRKKNPFKAYQQDKLKRREEIIRSSLAKVKRARFKSLTDLAHYLSNVITETELNIYEKENEKVKDGEKEPSVPKACSHITLLRNNEYRSLLDAFFIGQLDNKGDSKAVAIRQLEIELRGKKLEISQFKEDLKRANMYIEQSGVDPQFLVERKEQHAHTEELETDINKLCMAMETIIKNLSDFIAIEDGAVVDLSREKSDGTHTAIVPTQMMAPYNKRMKKRL